MRPNIDVRHTQELLARPISRRGFVAASGGGLALVGGGAFLLDGIPALAASSGDLAIVNFALTAEYLAVDAYTKAIAAAKAGQLGSVPANVASTLETFLSQEQQHVTALKSAGGTATAPTFTYPADTFTSLANAGKLALTLETAFVGAYVTAAAALQSTDLQTAAGTIGANEGEHRVILRGFLSMTPVVDLAFEKPVSVADATAAVKMFVQK